MRGVVILLGFLLLLAGGAMAVVQLQRVPSLDLSFLASIPGAQDFLKTQTALYAGGGAAGFGLLLMIVGMATGGSKKREARKATAEFRQVAAPPPKPQLKPASSPQTRPTVQPQPNLQAAPAPRPAAAKPDLKPVPTAKPQASAAPPPGAQTAAQMVTQASPKPTAQADSAPTWAQDPRLTNRKRVSDLVSINDALKAYHARNGSYPKADGLHGFADRGKTWIPGLSPDFIADLPRDPAESNDQDAPQYLYVSNGTDYKLLASAVNLTGGTNVEVLGVRIDPSKQNTMEKAAFGFWTEAFASV